MYKKIATYCLIVSVILIGNNVGAEVILNHIMAKDSNSGTGCQSPTPNYTFSTRDARAYCWVDVDDVLEGDVVKYEWYDPNSELYVDYTHTMSFTGDGCTWDWITIRNDAPADMPGEWHVDVFYNDTFQFTEKFTIEEGSCAIRQIYGENSEKTQRLRSFRDNLLNTAPEGREIIQLYYQWSPVIVRAMEADEDFKEAVKGMVDGVLEMMGGAVK